MFMYLRFQTVHISVKSTFDMSWRSVLLYTDSELSVTLLTL